MSTASVTPAKARPRSGAQVFLEVLASLGVEALFCNPGTTELAFVEALEGCSRPRAILVTQELVATGAADGYGRLHGLGAALLHLGPGFANGAAFVHNAKRAGTPMIVGVGEHPAGHRAFDVGLATRLEEVLAPFCVEVLRVDQPRSIVPVTRRAAEEAYSRRGPIGLILPSDVMEASVKDDVFSGAPIVNRTGPAPVVSPLGAELGPRPLLLLGSDALGEEEQRLAVALAQRTGGSLRSETFPAVMARGGGLAPLPRLPYLPSAARRVLEQASSVVLVGAEEPIAYFQPPDGSARLVPEGVPIVELTRPWQGARAVLAALVNRPAPRCTLEVPRDEVRDDQALTAANLGRALVHWIEEGDVVVDEARSSSAALADAFTDAPRHTLVGHPGGAIGGGLSLALGGAVGARARVLALVADGGSLYAPQALWSIAREHLPVLVVVLDNGGYEILRTEMRARGFCGESLTRLPGVSYVALMESFGVPSTEVATVGALRGALADPVPLPRGVVVRLS